MDGGRVSLFIDALDSIITAWLTVGRGSPHTARQSSSTANLGSFQARRSSDTWATRAGNACLLPSSTEAERLSRDFSPFSLLGLRMRRVGTLQKDGRGFLPTPRERQRHLASLFPFHASGWKQQSQLLQCLQGASSKP